MFLRNGHSSWYVRLLPASKEMTQTLWSSDITMATFSSYKIQNTARDECLRSSGIPYWTSDIGGYHLNWVSPDWNNSGKQRTVSHAGSSSERFADYEKFMDKGERALYSDNWRCQYEIHFIEL